MAYFPLYMDIGEKNCLVIGGGKVAEDKAGWLLEFGGAVTVVAKEATDRIREWDKAGRICFRQRGFLEEDIEGASLVVAATNRRDIHEIAAALCREKKIPINVVDDKKLCTFFFPAIIKQKDVVVSVSTGGNSPALAARMKRELEALLPDSYGEAAEIMGRFREQVIRSVEDREERRKIFEEMLEEVLSGKKIS